jgi:hypothetical protein
MECMFVDRSIRSPNHVPRGDRSIQMIVLHATAGSARGALAWLTNPAAKVSAHYLIDKTGHIYQLVSDEEVAWHAGRAHWRGETAINEISIGIELENANNGNDPYPPEQIDALLELTRDKVERYRIRPDMIARHLDVALPKGRKSDPAGFPWAAFMGQLFPQNPPPRERPPRPPTAPASARLADLLLAEAYRQVGAAERHDWAMARLARAESLGMPLGPSIEVRDGNRSYTAQSFGRETLFSPTGDWQRVERLSALADPAQRSLRDALLRAVYAQADETYHPDWAFHQYALRNPLGPPVGPSGRLTVGGVEYVAACYALDVLYSPVGRWKEIGRLTQLAGDSGRRALARALQDRWFARSGGAARSEWQLDQYGLRERLGAPLGLSFRVTDEGRDYVAQAFALDVIACEIGSWKAIVRLSSLLT